MKYSIIVPCYKVEPFFKRLMDSIVAQHFDDMEVILVRDDDSDLEKMAADYPMLNIRVVDTDKKLHNPGNTRNYGLDVAIGEWIIFIDCDDCLREGAIDAFNRAMEDKLSPCYFAKIKQYHPDGSPYENDEEYQARHIVWLHGKCYHAGFLREHKIRFKDTMVSCEDYYFNYQVMAFAFSYGYDFYFMDDYVYDWMWNDNSLSRSSLYHISMREHFEDYVEASLVPWVKVSPDSIRERVFDMFMMHLSVNYFLYQYYNSRNIYYSVDNVRKAMAKVWEVFGTSYIDIINEFENNYDKYMERYKLAVGVVEEDFICPHSFRDWMFEMFK